MASVIYTGLPIEKWEYHEGSRILRSRDLSEPTVPGRFTRDGWTIWEDGEAVFERVSDDGWTFTTSKTFGSLLEAFENINALLEGGI